MTNAQQSFDVFLAHNSQDKSQVRQIAHKLKSYNLKIWLDEDEIPPGRSFQDEIQKAIPLVKAAAIFLGLQGLGRWQIWELEAIISSCVEKNIPVIPVLLPGVSEVPKHLVFLRRFQWVSFSQTIDDQKALNSFVWGITGEKSPLLSNSDKKPGRVPTYKDILQLEVFVLNIAKSTVTKIFSKLIDSLVGKISTYQQQDNREVTEIEDERIADEITKEEFVITAIKKWFQPNNNSSFDQEQLKQVSSEIKILLKRFFKELNSSAQKRPDETNIEMIKKIGTPQKFNEIVLARRTELKVKNQPQSPISKPIVNKNQDHQLGEIKTSAEPVEVKSRDSDEATHPGWLAIDFGTSNSTVTVFDQKEVRDPNQELPKQQRERLSLLFKNWLHSQPHEVPDVIRKDDWEKFVKEVDKNLNLAGKGNVTQILTSEASSGFLELTRQIELCLGSQQQSLRKAVGKKLNDIYHEVFQVPPLEDDSLILIELDPNTPNEYQIISELQITNLGDPLQVKMGSLVSQQRLQAISTATNEDTFKQIEGQFHPSPKRYFIAQDPEFIDVYLEKEHKKVAVEDLVKAAWRYLIESTENYKNKKPEKFLKGRFKRAIVTYPTVSPPAVRSEIENLVKDLGFIDVKTYYDEAIAAAIFYLWREFSGNKTIGLEAFKTRSRRSEDKWAQNVLVLDIGGGTTDLALIRLVLEEKNPFNPGEDRGAGGRYYVLTPDLMGSSGHLRLGGELLTLRVFRLLKVAIADCILTAVAEEKLKNDELKKISDSVDLSFRPDNGKFIGGALLRYVSKKNAEGDARYKLALDIAEQVLPTRWKEDSKRLQAFYTLWEHAEKAKVELGKGTEDFELDLPKVKELLSYNNNEFQFDNQDFIVKITKDQFKQVVSQDIEEAIRLATGLLESRLPEDESKKEKQPLDWLILSGQTCKLNLVRDKFKDVFSSSSNIHLNRTRITFVDEYAKLATSVGACYAERLQQYRYDPQGAKRKLKNGYSEVEIKIKNLLNTLPCTFVRKSQDGQFIDEIFKPGQSLFQFDQEQIAKARSEWRPLQSTNTIYRKDYKGAKEIPWVNFVFEEMARRLGVYSDTKDYLEPFKVQFEVNQKLEISLLLCNGKPHYLINSEYPSLNVGEKILEELKIRNESEQHPQTIISSESVQAQKESEQYPQTIFSNGGKLDWEIVIDVQEGAKRTIFKAGESLDQSFRYSGNSEEKTSKGLLSESVEDFPANGKYTIYAYYPSLANPKGRPIYLGELEPPDSKPKENFPYHLTIDEQGLLRIHEGAYFYWQTSENSEDLKNREGCVVRIQPDPISESKDEERNPFSGTH
jgi:molecular chaperone DnaK (HSP70)